VPADVVEPLTDAVAGAFAGRGWKQPGVFEVTPSGGAHRDA
jgi:hypothetical protein